MSEELRKWELIKADENSESDVLWVDLIKNAESHPCFKGKIVFFLNLAKDNKNEFVRLYNKISPLFNIEILGHEDKLLQRALLTKGNYFDKRKEDTYYLLKNDMSSYRARRENWLGFLLDSNKTEIITLIDDDMYDYNFTEKSLRNIIADYIKKNPLSAFANQPIENIAFHQSYIYCQQLFSYGESKLIRLSQNKYAYQLNKTNTGGYFNDVILEFIKSTYFNNNDNVKIHRTMGWDNSPSIEVENYFIEVVPSENKVVVKEDDNIIQEFTTMNEVIQYIKKISQHHDQSNRTHHSKSYHSIVSRTI